MQGLVAMEQVMSFMDDLKEELRDIRDSLEEVGGLLATSKAAEIMTRTDTSPGELAAEYCRHCARAGRTELPGYKLSFEELPSNETPGHIVLDPEINRVVIYEEW